MGMDSRRIELLTVCLQSNLASLGTCEPIRPFTRDGQGKYFNLSIKSFTTPGVVNDGFVLQSISKGGSEMN